MKIIYWSDYACPYCYIGEARLKKAIKDLDFPIETSAISQTFLTVISSARPSLIIFAAASIIFCRLLESFLGLPLLSVIKFFSP